MKKEEIIKILKEVNNLVGHRYKADIKGIFGSYVREEQRVESDIDILVEFASDADLIHFVGLCIFLEEKLGIRVDVVPYDTIRTEVKEDIMKEAIYL